MPKRLAVAAVLLISAFALGAEEALYQIDLVPSGKLISRDLPTLKGTTYLFHQFPSGTLVSVRKSTVKQITRMSATAASSVNPKTRIVPIGDLAMQGPRTGSSGGRYSIIDHARSTAGAANAGTAGRTASPD